MPVETVTIINNSGKIITNGKHLFGLFKEAKASYQEKKAAIKVERAIKRSNTYDVACTPEYYDEVEYLSAGGRRVSYDDAASHTSSRRSHKSRHSRAPTLLTESNLKTLSEVSSVTPSRAPTARTATQSQYNHDMALSKPSLARTKTLPMEVIESRSLYDSQPMQPLTRRSTVDPAAVRKEEKKIDMNMAYGSMPPDLADRVDLDPAYKAAQKERKAQDLAHKIEGLLTEAHCMHHTANHMIAHLQSNPEAAAAVALTLAELSALLGKMSPGFLGAIKAGSPAVFALLASPQFLIAAGVTVGMTVVMFGGWKIVKRIADAHQEIAGAGPPRAAPMAYEAYPASAAGTQRTVRQAPYPATEHSASVFDEALVLEEELSSIETWRRGISQCGADDESSVDLELITPEAMHSQYGGDDARTVRSVRTNKTSKTHKTEKTHKSSRSEAPRDDYHKSSSRTVRDGDSVAGSERSHRTSHSHRSSQSKRTVRTIEDGSRDRENSFEEVVGKPKKDNMLKNLFKKKKEKDERSRMESVMA